MEQICRLCCSTKFVNNYIFDEGTALYWKLSLYLPIKVIKDDQLPQKICDKCSCKVNDIYQFCNETIEVQNRLRSMLIEPCITNLEMVDLTLIKPASSPPPLVHVPMQCQPMHRQCEQSTQTDSTLHSVHKPDQCTQTDSDKPCLIPKLDISVKIKQEVDVQSEIHVVKVEEANYNNMYDTNTNIPSDSSDNVSLINLKKKKTKKLAKNGEIKKSKKQKPQKKEWEMFMNALPEGIGVGSEGNGLGEVKQELGCPTLAGNLLSAVKSKGVKTEVCDIDIFNCCICFEQCYSRSEMLQHYKQHKRPSDADEPAPPAPPPPASLKCPRCSKSVSAAEWTSHWRRHWERDHRPFRCALCEKAFRDHTQILKHGLTHKLGADGLEATQLPDKRYICDLCPEAFVYMRYLLSHRARAHPEALGRALALRCALCARHFAHLNSLRRHLRAHSGERSHLCSVCGKALSSREHLKFHIRIHTGYKPNVCKTCGKGFVKKCNLTLHERVHSGEKPHVCATCGKAFSQRSTLVIHERYHSGARPYACALCGRGFVAKGLLSMHLKTTCI